MIVLLHFSLSLLMSTYVFYVIISGILILFPFPNYYFHHLKYVVPLLFHYLVACTKWGIVLPATLEVLPPSSHSTLFTLLVWLSYNIVTFYSYVCSILHYYLLMESVYVLFMFTSPGRELFVGYSQCQVNVYWIKGESNFKNSFPSLAQI